MCVRYSEKLKAWYLACEDLSWDPTATLFNEDILRRDMIDGSDLVVSSSTVEMVKYPALRGELRSTGRVNKTSGCVELKLILIQTLIYVDGLRREIEL